MKKVKKLKLSYIQKNICLLILVVILGLLPLIISQQYILNVIILCFMYSCLALSLNLIIGWSGQFSLGHVCFYGMGAYVTAILMKNYHVDFFLAMLAGVVITGIFAALLCLPTLKLRGDYVAVVTLGFGEVFRLFLTNSKITNGATGFYGIDKPVIFGVMITGKPMFYYFALILLVLFVAFMLRLNNSGFGMAMMTVNEDDIAATAIGLDKKKYKLWAFVIGGCMASVIGSFYAVYLSIIAPKSFDYAESINMVSMVVLGGLGSIPGSVIGACILTALPELLRSFSQWRMVIYGIAMVIMMIFRPEGLWGRNKRMKNEYKIKAMRGKKYGKSIAD